MAAAYAQGSEGTLMQLTFYLCVYVSVYVTLHLCFNIITKIMLNKCMLENVFYYWQPLV